MSVQDFTRGTSAFGDEVSQEPQRPQHPNISAAITDAAQKNQVVFIGDTDHGSMELVKFRHSSELLDAAQKGGIKHIFIEMPASYQSLADELEGGELSREEFIKKLDNQIEFFQLSGNDEKQQYLELADFILAAKERGMKIHFGDQNTFTGDIEGTLARETTKALEEKYSDEEIAVFQDNEHILAEIDLSNPNLLTNKLSDTIKNTPDAMDHLQNLTPKEQETFLKIADDFQNIGKEIFAGRRLNETDSVQYALDVMGDQKFMMIWGAGHDAPRDYLDKLGIKNHTIDIVDPQSKTDPTGISGPQDPNAKAYLGLDKVETVAGNAKDERGAKPGLGAQAAPQLQPVM